jgi:PLP dependent protein
MVIFLLLLIHSNRHRIYDVMQISEQLKKVKNVLPNSVKLVAISKTQSPERILEAYNAGQRIFGENKVQELDWKSKLLPRDIEWHLVGHLQTNKVKLIVPYISLIHSVDSFKLLSVIDNEAQKAGRIIPCLLQTRIAKEETKYGLTPQAMEEILTSNEFYNLKNISINGLMGMATFTADTYIVRDEFKQLYSIFNTIKLKYFYHSALFSEISMGMSDDYKIAIEEGSTMVRLGRIIFGGRNYSTNLFGNDTSEN